ncbi:unnamed protein product [Prunus armeniaca]
MATSKPEEISHPPMDQPSTIYGLSAADDNCRDGRVILLFSMWASGSAFVEPRHADWLMRLDRLWDQLMLVVPRSYEKAIVVVVVDFC